MLKTLVGSQRAQEKQNVRTTRQAKAVARSVASNLLWIDPNEVAQWYLVNGSCPAEAPSQLLSAVRAMDHDCIGQAGQDEPIHNV